MIETDSQQDSRAIALALELDRAGIRKDLSEKLRHLVGTENESRWFAATHQAEAALAAKAAEVAVAASEPALLAVAAELSAKSDEATEPVEDVKAMADEGAQTVDAMIVQAKKFIAEEPGDPDLVGMRAILAKLETLSASERTETDDPAGKAGSSYAQPSEMPAEVRDHLGKHKKMVSKYGAAPMNEWAAEMGIEQQQASGGN